MDGQTWLRTGWRVSFLLVATAILVGLPTRSGAQEERSEPVYVIEVSGTIDLGLAPYLERALDDAEEAGASTVVIEIDTPGGRLDAVIQMRDALLDSPLRTVALVDASAFSAGALVAIASEEIYLTPGAAMGAATPVMGGSGEVADEKTISAVRATFESTAEERGRDPQIAGAMVDPEIEIEGLIAQGRLLTLTVTQAGDVGYADGVVDDRASLLDELGLADRELVETGPSLAEQLVRVVTNPVVASALLTIGTLALIADLVSGGVGVGVVVGLGCLAVFFWGHMLAGLAGWEDVVLVVLGLVLIGVEIFVVPGVGVPGILGLLALLGGGFLAIIYRDFDFVTNDDLRRAAITMSVTFIAIVAGVVLVFATLSRRGPPSRLVLRPGAGPAATPVSERPWGGWLRWFDVSSRLPAEGRPSERDDVAATDTAPGDPTTPSRDGDASLAGATGTALSDLRPSGIADIGGARVDVVTTGDYIRSGEPIEVISDERYRRVVQRRQS